MEAVKFFIAVTWLFVGSRLLAMLALGIRDDVEELKRILREEEDHET